MLPNPLETADLLTFTEEILNGKLHFFWSETEENISYLHLFIHWEYTKEGRKKSEF